MTSPTYNPEIIERFASKLYERANRVVWLWGCLGMFIGLFLGAAAAGSSNGLSSEYRIGLLVSAVFIGLFIGRSIGTDRAFHLWLQAQTALCQVQIERNTRAPS